MRDLDLGIVVAALVCAAAAWYFFGKKNFLAAFCAVCLVVFFIAPAAGESALSSALVSLGVAATTGILTLVIVCVGLYWMVLRPFRRSRG